MLCIYTSMTKGLTYGFPFQAAQTTAASIYKSSPKTGVRQQRSLFFNISGTQSSDISNVILLLGTSELILNDWVNSKGVEDWISHHTCENEFHTSPLRMTCTKESIRPLTLVRSFVTEINKRYKHGNIFI